MRIPRSWLAEFLRTDFSTDQLYPVLTMGIAEVESIETVEGDDVLNVELKPDRGDCWSVEGLAREVAALTGTGIRTPEAIGRNVLDGQPSAGSSPANVAVEEPDLCPRYIGLVVEDVSVGDSPDWLQRRIRQAGLRPVNNVVDVTNYVLLELGQPLHAFDLDRLEDSQIRVRRAAAGETLVAINGDEYKLIPSDLVIADASRAVAIAGVMGGLETEVSTGTHRLLIESAYFDPITVRLTSRRLRLQTPASQRFERHVDPAGALRAALRAASLITEVAGGRISGAPIDRSTPLPPRAPIRLRSSRACKLLGMSIPVERMQEVLERLQLTVTRDGEDLLVTPPSWRADLSIEEDLVEEVIRVIGYSEVPTTLPVGATTPGGVSPERWIAEAIRDALTGCGYTEVRSYSLTNTEALTRAGFSGPTAALRNPTSTDRAVLRPELLPALLEAAEANLGHGFRNQHLFSVERVFPVKKDQEKPAETTHIAGLAMGSAWSSAWNLQDEATVSDFYSVRGVLEDLGHTLRTPLGFKASSDHPALHPGRSAAVMLPNGHRLGFLGELHPDIIARFSLPGRPVAFELAFEPLAAAARENLPRSLDGEIARQPPATRDLAVVVPESVPFSQVLEIALGTHPLVTQARLFDLYRGAGIGEGAKSLALALTLRAPGRTLTDTEANSAIDAVVAALTDRLGARRR